MVPFHQLFRTEVFTSFLTLLGALPLILLAGCNPQRASHRVSVPVNDTAELRLIVADTLNALEPTLHTLESLQGLKGPCPPQLCDRFNRDTQRLLVDSLNFRAHARAMERRGQPYFEEWQTHLRSTDDRGVPGLATGRRDLSQRDFSMIHEETQQADAKLSTFLADIRALRRALEKESESDSTKGVIQKSHEDGQSLEQELAGLERELDSVIAELTPEKREPKVI